MKKTLTVVLMLALIAGAFAAAPAQAKKKKKKAPVRTERVVEIEYVMGGIGISSPAASGGICPMTEPGSGECIEVPVLSAAEKYIKVEIADALPTTIAGFISQGDTDGDGIGDLYGDFCGGHEAPIALEGAGAPVRISFYAGTCADGSGVSFPTTGTITVTFSNMP